MTQAPGKGHNVIDTKQLREFCEKIESLLEDRKEINASINVIKEEAEHMGYDKKMLAEMVKVRAMDQQERQERQELRDMYLQALGLL